ncbi:MAG: CoA transferase, partial [Acidimicrobiaceae bacterium]|nr:CoA transferase [Acidimicrobiaceae bacterium]
MPGPLDGIRIVEMSVAVTGPLAVTLLVDQGAEAIKVEEPGFGDQGRYVGVASGGISALFQMCNRGKRSVAVDCTHPKGRDIVLDLAAGADVFVQNMRPGVVERLGLGYDDVSTRNPGVVYASLSGFGPDGPYAHRRVYDSVIQAQAGLVGNQTGINDASPRFLRQAAADKITAYTAAQAITAALLARERGAGGQHVQLAMLDASVAFLF